MLFWMKNMGIWIFQDFFFFFWFICMHEGNNSQEMYNLFPTTELKLDNNFFDFWCDAVAKK